MLASPRVPACTQPPLARRPGSADQAETLLAMWTAPVLDDLPVTDTQDRGAVDGHRLARRWQVVERRAGVRAFHRPVGHDEIVGLDEQVDGKGHVGEGR